MTTVAFDGKTMAADGRATAEDVFLAESWPAPMAIGSGKLPVLAAMRAGADARRAVEVAISMDVFSGGHIRTAVL
ncbi:hypothetical protein [Chromobacterium subtsugae]|uniref:hypothetical protein n=1 Tax=Chromobacterium subtsugae TaxID=251747 RepID=UPI0007F8CC6A|nr:hypothetical protein [Chromobacterium subtsugae]OBU85480.1 hypothetical protein MY55_15995 [Chromobacterium subtsugae]